MEYFHFLALGSKAKQSKERGKRARKKEEKKESEQPYFAVVVVVLSSRFPFLNSSPFLTE